MSKPATTSAFEPRRVGVRYELRALLGRGGMATVYQATDLASGREVALKELSLPESSRERASVTTLFEREFHTLAQLAHPRVIAVYDYGIGSDGPYYTMELLDGGDLRERAPMPWQNACELLFDVCSSLALLHSRRLLHRDISPRNIRCTRDGKAKLIDFGAMATMGTAAPVVGTPAFTAPETLHRLAADGRADLFSLGATLYTALTGQLAYPARSFAEVVEAWKVRPVPPSARGASVPPALDDLVMSLISPEPSQRPQGAFDVMQRLAAIAGLVRDEASEVQAAYLATPLLVGREAVLDSMRAQLSRALRGSGGAMLLQAPPGLGRTRVLDACLLEAKTQGATILRASANGEPEPFAVARALAEQLVATQPAGVLAAEHPELLASVPANDNAGPRLELKHFGAEPGEPERIQQAFCHFVLAQSRAGALVVAVDDVQRIDASSAAVLAALIDRLKRSHVAVVLTAESGAADSRALDILSRRCNTIELAPLTRPQTQALLTSVFGDVANLEGLAREIHAVALGNPRSCMDLAQHLVDQRVVRYASGAWTLPERLRDGDLPRSAEDALRAQLETLSEVARFIAEAQALAYYEAFGFEDYRALRPDLQASTVDNAVTELVSLGVITSAGGVHALANRLWTSALRSCLTPEAEAERHRALAEMYRPRAQLAAIHHLFAAGAEEEGLEAVTARHREYASQGVDLNKIVDDRIHKFAPTYQQAIAAAEKHGRSAREIAELHHWAVALSALAQGAGYAESAPSWFQHLKRDSGLELWQSDPQGGSPGDRLTRALQGAFGRYVATPEAQRVYAVDEAIRQLAEYVLLSIVNGARTLDMELIERLPGVLEPFAPLAPVLDAIWQNAVATAEAQCEVKFESARTRWIDVLRKLDNLPPEQNVPQLDAVRNAIAYAVGLIEAQLGLPTATDYAERLERDPLQRLSAIHLRKIVRLEQGDWAGADRLRREAEVLSLHARSINMFNSLVGIECTVYALAGDLVGMQQTIDQLRQMAAGGPGWELVLLDAEAYFDLVRGDHAVALQRFEHLLTRVAMDADGRSRSRVMWLSAQAGVCEALLELKRPEEARDRTRAAIALAERLGMSGVHAELAPSLALAEARGGEVAAAIVRLDRSISAQSALGVSGPRIGRIYEARARIAIWSGDGPSYAHYSRLVAHEYRRGAHSPLSSRYERLSHEAMRRGFQVGAPLDAFESSSMLDIASTELPDIETAVLRAMTGVQPGKDRAKRALQLLCDAHAARGGHLYLTRGSALKLSASVGELAGTDELRSHVRAFLARDRSKIDPVTESVTTTAHGVAEPTHPTVRAGGEDYELLPLACVVDGRDVVAGAAALAPGKTRIHSVKRGHLLSTLAAHLVDTSDSMSTRRAR